MSQTIRRVLLFASLTGALLAQKKPVTVEALAQAQRPAQTRGNPLAWSPDGRSFVYREGTKLLVYDIPRADSRALLDTSALTAAAPKAAPTAGQPFEWENRRVADEAAEWGPSGQILFPAGGDLFLIDAESGKWNQLTHTSVTERDAKLSPDGKRVAFRRGWDLYSLDIASRKETRLTTGGSETLRNGGLDWVYPEELELGTAYWWSPDSKSILYLQFDISREPQYPHEDLRGTKAIFEPQRYPQAGDDNPTVRMGVVSAVGGPARWIDVGDTRRSYLIARAGWMPDSKRVWTVRLTRVQDRLELLSFPVQGGPAAKILDEYDPYWINVHGGPQFVGGDRFLWQSERDGFNHLYLYSLDGKNVTQLTRGAWEVTDAHVDEAGGRVLYVSSETSPLDRLIYSVRLDGSDKIRLTGGAGTHTMSMAPNAPYYVDTFSILSTPPVTTIHRTDGRQATTWRGADMRVPLEFDILPVELSSFSLSDGTQLYTRLIKPAGFEDGKKYPAIVRVYGGPGVQSVRNAWSGLSMDQVLANAGFVVWQVDNRGSIGRGHAFETPINRNMGVMELADQVAGVRHLISLGFVDPQRIGITGGSYGGFMTLNALLNAPDVFHAGVADAAVTNFRNYDTIYTERYMGLPDQNPEGYKKTALPESARNLKGRLMIVHNLEDDNVLFQNTLQMVDALERADKQFELMIYPQKTHGVRGAVTQQMNAAILDFFERTLK